MEEVKTEGVKVEEAKPKTGRKIAIVGTSDTMLFAPQDDPSWELWGVNNGFLKMKRWDLWFELHVISFDGLQWARRGGTNFRGMSVEQYLKSIDSLNVPVMMQGLVPLVKRSVVFPFKELMEFFQTKYFTNTISWETAYALWLAMKGEVDELAVYGVDMATTGGPEGTQEYGSQRPSCEYFLGLWNMWAKLTNHKPVYMPVECDLLKSRYIYGIQEIPETEWDKKCANTINAMHQRLAAAEGEEQRARDKRMQYIGGMSAIKDMARNWGNVGVGYGRSS